MVNTYVKYISSRPWTPHFVPAASHLPPPPCCSRSQIHQSGFSLDTVSQSVRVDSDHILHDRVHNLFRQVLQAHQDFLKLTIVGYTAPPAPLKPLSKWVPYNPHNVRAVSVITPTRVELQEKFDQLEQFQVFIILRTSELRRLALIFEDLTPSCLLLQNFGCSTSTKRPHSEKKLTLNLR